MYRFLLPFAFAAAPLIVSLFNIEELPLLVALPLSVGGLAAGFTILLENKIDAKSGPFTPGATLSILYPLHFILPILVWFWIPSVLSFCRPATLEKTAWAIALGIILQATGYLITRRLLASSPRVRATDRLPRRSPATENASAIYFAVLISLDVVAKLTRIWLGAYFQLHLATHGNVPNVIWNILILCSNLAVNAYAFATVKRLSRPSAKGWAIAARSAWIVQLLYSLPTGRKEAVIFVLILPVLLESLLKGWQAIRVSRLIWILAGLGFTFSVVSSYRMSMNKTFFSGDLATSVDAVRRLIDKSDGLEDGDSVTTVVNGFFERLSLTDSVYLTLEKTPEKARLNGQSIIQIVWLFIPRAIWPTKPTLELGTEFGQRYGYTESDDTVTSISVTFLGDFIWNFGFAGVLCMLGLGVINALLYHWLVSRPDPFKLSCYVAYWLPIAYIGGTFAMSYGGIVNMLVFFTVLWIASSALGRLIAEHQPDRRLGRFIVEPRRLR